jgi:hypothetical protein
MALNAVVMLDAFYVESSTFHSHSMALNAVVMLNAFYVKSSTFHSHTECHYPECRYGTCHGANNCILLTINKQFLINI